MGHEEGGEQDSHNWRQSPGSPVWRPKGKICPHWQFDSLLAGFTNKNVFSLHTFLEILQAYNTLHKVYLLLSFMRGQTYSMVNVT